MPTDGTYTLKLIAKNDISVQNPQKFLGFTRQGGESAAAVLWAWSGSFTATAGQEFIITNDVYSNYRMVSMYPKNQATLEWFMENFDIQLEQGSTATTYEAYTEQDYEVNLGKNLLENKNTDRTYVGLTYTVNEDGSFHVSGTAGTSAQYYITANGVGYQGRTLDLPAGTYTFHGFDENGVKFECNYSEDGVSGSKYALGTFTTTRPTHVGVYLTIAQGTTVDRTFYPMLERGSKATSWSPYFTPLELAKIGTHQDRIYKEGEKWYIEKNVGKLTITGNESAWGVATFTNNPNHTIFQTREYDTIIGGATAFDSMSDYFIQSPTVVYTSMPAFDGAIVSIGSGGNYKTRFGVPNSVATDATTWTTWLSTHPTTVYYALATPTTTEITNQTLIDQLEALAGADLNQGVNNIFTEIATGNAMPTLELNWVEWEKYNRHNVYIWNDDIDDWQVIVGAGA